MAKKETKFNVRKRRVRYKINSVNKNRMRLSIFKSGRHLYASLIDDNSHKTLTSSSTMEKGIYIPGKSNRNKDSAHKLGTSIADKAVALGIKDVVFDRSGFKFHGVIKVLAEAAREKLNF